MQRRALAFHMAGIATFTVLDKVISRFFGHMMRPVYPGQLPVVLRQVVDADKTLWVLVAQETRGKALTSGTPLPIDEAVESLKDAPKVSFALMPRAHGSGNVPPPPKPHADPDAPDSITRAKRRGWSGPEYFFRGGALSDRPSPRRSSRKFFQLASY
ncbi:unnamed protein product [Symbiodinium microadriaticum]|nr:unnamed protein product [Symbiodinium microadriaticum]